MTFEDRIELAGAVRPVVADGPHRYELTSPVTGQQTTVILEGIVSRSLFVGQPPMVEPAPQAVEIRITL